MARGQSELENAVREAAQPSWADVLRAKRAILAVLADGQPHGITTIQQVLINADGIPPAAHRETLLIPTADDVEAIVASDPPIIARVRLAVAATDALVDLVSLGLVVEVASAPTHETSQPVIRPGQTTISYRIGGFGSGLQLNPPIPRLAEGYRLAPRIGATDVDVWFLDPDLFVADVDQLRLHARGRRCIVEALAAYRSGLYLACASLLGAASEAAWYSAGEQLRHLHDRLGPALDGDHTSKVVKLLSDVLRQAPRLRTTVDDLCSTEALLRQLRNYGVHPRLDDGSHLERYLSDATAAVLILETHSYLTRLASAVASRVDQDDP